MSNEYEKFVDVSYFCRFPMGKEKLGNILITKECDEEFIGEESVYKHIRTAHYKQCLNCSINVCEKLKVNKNSCCWCLIETYRWEGLVTLCDSCIVFFFDIYFNDYTIEEILLDWDFHYNIKREITA